MQVSVIIVKKDQMLCCRRCCCHFYLIHARKLQSHRLTAREDGGSVDLDFLLWISPIVLVPFSWIKRYFAIALMKLLSRFSLNINRGQKKYDGNSDSNSTKAKVVALGELLCVRSSDCVLQYLIRDNFPKNL